MADLGRRYLEVALRLGRLAPELVEGYTGPVELAEQVDAEPAPTPRSLRQQARELSELASLEEPDPVRRRWFSAQLSAIAAFLSWRDGEPAGYRELARRCHGITVELEPDERFGRAHALLDRALPGHGDVRERYQAWRDTQLVPPERLAEGLDALAQELRRRSREAFGLPDDEKVSFELVSGVPWAGNATALDPILTRIEINEDLPIASMRLLELVSHEAYPGHHAEHVCKRTSLIDAHDRLELAVYVYPTPQAVLAEGLACHALEALLGEDAETVGARCLEPLGIAYDVEVAAAVREAEQLLLPVNPNMAIMLGELDASMDEVLAYARRWKLDSDALVARVVQSLAARTWPPYESCYPAGLDLCRRFTAGDPARFRMLLHEQLTLAAPP